MNIPTLGALCYWKQERKSRSDQPGLGIFAFILGIATYLSTLVPCLLFVYAALTIVSEDPLAFLTVVSYMGMVILHILVITTVARAITYSRTI